MTRIVPGWPMAKLANREGRRWLASKSRDRGFASEELKLDFFTKKSPIILDEKR
ncbi:hypothetical protein [Ollibium composti]|uniref:hypothetical protein n=1 Tax=Ollibium composti TaxID=2675109 RepID=UPI001454B9F3|nr:hypothetical protein [Mesorhizobium composti]